MTSLYHHLSVSIPGKATYKTSYGYKPLANEIENDSKWNVSLFLSNASVLI